jgi:uncharacterized membrane protein
MEPLGQSSTGLPAPTAAALAVLLGWPAGLFFYLAEKDSRFVRFYAKQSVALALSFAVAEFVICILLVTAALVFQQRFLGTDEYVKGAIPLILLYFTGWGGLVAAFIAGLIMLTNAYSGRVWLLPLAGSWCKQQAGL